MKKRLIREIEQNLLFLKFLKVLYLKVSDLAESKHTEGEEV